MVFSNTTYMNRSYHLPAQVFILQCVYSGEFKELRPFNLFSNRNLSILHTKILPQVVTMQKFSLPLF
jgi:hypothetical protein